uniref:RNA-dependent RNA polymerase n=1 Tax=Wangarabell virus TaxID=2485882 RepID=A0A3G3BTJ8_9VIRU|nr:RNA-dependent RNA polymerase [Wangarabell virus]
MPPPRPLRWSPKQVAGFTHRGSRRRQSLPQANTVLRYLGVFPDRASKETRANNIPKERKTQSRLRNGQQASFCTFREVRERLRRIIPSCDKKLNSNSSNSHPHLRDVKSGDYERLDHVIEVIFSTWVAIYSRKALRVPRVRMRALRALNWVIETCALTGVVGLIKTIKEWALWCRTTAITGRDRKTPDRLSRVLLLNFPRHIRRNGKSTVLLQASYISRALPMGGPELDEAALKEHNEDLLHEVVIPDELLEEGERWARTFVKGRRLKAHFTLPSLDVTSGATLTSTRGEGGLANDICFLCQVVDRGDMVTCPRTGLSIPTNPHIPSDSLEVPRELCFRPNECVGPKGQILDFSNEPDIVQNGGAWDNYVNDKAIICRAISEVVQAHRRGRYPVIKREVVREYGYKVRIVTKAPATLQIAGKVVRKILLSALRKWKPLEHILVGNRHEAIRQIISQNPPNTGIFVSTDLTKATDKVSYKFVTKLFVGLAEELGLHQDLIDVGRVCLGPHCINDEHVGLERLSDPEDALSELNYIDADSAGKRLTLNGILMGNPLTWLMLNVCQAFCVDSAWQIAEKNLRIGREWKISKKLIDQTYSVCGDDLIAYWPSAVADLYGGMLTRLGFRTNEKKHYLSPIGGIFTEIAFFGKKKSAKVPLYQVTKPVIQSVTRVALAHMPYNIVVTAKPDPRDPESKRLIVRQEIRKEIRESMVGIRFPGCFPIKGLVHSTCDNERLFDIGSSLRQIAEHANKKNLIDVARYLLRDQIKKIRQRGIVPEFPQLLGGANLWFARTARRDCKMHRRAVASLCYGLTSELDSGILSRKWTIPQKTSSWWGMAEQSAKADLYADSAFRYVSSVDHSNFPLPPQGIRWVPDAVEEDTRDPTGLTSVGRLFGHPNPEDRLKPRRRPTPRKVEDEALDSHDLKELDESNGLYNPDRLVIELALEYEKTFVVQMGPMTAGPGYRTCIGRVCTQLRKEFKDLVARWPAAKPVTNYQKAETALLNRVQSILAVPAVYSFEPQLGSKEPALLGWHTSAARRGVYRTLGWNQILRSGTSTVGNHG